MKRLRIGIKLPFFPNAGVYARDVAAEDAMNANTALTVLKRFGFEDGKRFGIATIVARLDEKGA